MAQEEDPIIESIPVFISNAFYDSLVMMQFPLVPADSPFMTSQNPLVSQFAFRIKKNNKLVEFDLPLDTKTPTYDLQKGYELAKGINQNTTQILASGEDDERLDHSYYHQAINNKKSVPLFDKIVHSSQHIGQEDGLIYFVACLDENRQVHLNKLSDIYQLRPSMKYLDEIESKNKQINKKISSLDVSSQSFSSSLSAQTESTSKALQVQFRRKETEEETMSRLKSYTYYQKMVDEESWIDLNFIPQSQFQQSSEKTKNKLICQSTDSLLYPIKDANRVEYLKRIFPLLNITKVSSGDHHNYCGLYSLIGLPLESQVKQLVTRTKIFSFSRMCNILGISSEEKLKLNSVLQELEKHAIFIQNRWICKSEYFVEFSITLSKPTSATSSAMSAYSSYKELIKQIRNFLLVKFSEIDNCRDSDSPGIRRKSFLEEVGYTTNRLVKIPAEFVEKMFSEIASLQQQNHSKSCDTLKRDWKLKEFKDTIIFDSFINSDIYNLALRRQAQVIESLKETCKEYFSERNASTEKKANGTNKKSIN